MWCIAALSQDDQGGEARNDSEQDAFRRAMATRRRRSKQFLSDPMAAFTILLMLTLHHYLSQVTQIAFALTDADRKGIQQKQPTQRKKEKLRRRLRFKGAEAFAEPQPLPDTPSLADLFAKASEVVQLLWKAIQCPEALAETLFAIPAAYFPETEHKETMHRKLTDDLLKTISGLRWRFLDKTMSPPYKYLDLIAKDVEDESAQKAADDLCGTPPCCLDPFWGKPIFDAVKEAGDADIQGRALSTHMKTFGENVRGVSSREECLHASQRVAAGGWKGKAALFERQSADSVVRCSLDHYTLRSGISVGKQSKEMKVKTKSVRKRVAANKHSRPNQYGSAFFFFKNCKKRDGCTATFQELNRQWQQMEDVEKEQWKRKHVFQVAKRRFAAKPSVNQNIDQETEHVKSPWGLGDSHFPLTEAAVDRFLQPFRQKESGLHALKQIIASKTANEASDLKEHVRAIEDGERKYHSMDAATAAARSMFAGAVAEADIWKQISQVERAPQPCSEKHFGICRTVDEAALPTIMSLAQTLPKNKNCALMFRLGKRPAREQVVLFARSITGVKTGGNLGCLRCHKKLSNKS